MENKQAEAMLQALVAVPGALQIVTPLHNCVDGETHNPDQDVCDAYTARTGFSAKDVRHQVCVDVTRIEGPDDKGRYHAFADDGSETTGYASALFERLTQRSRAGDTDSGGVSEPISE